MVQWFNIKRDLLNPGLNYWFSSGQKLNLEPNLGSVQFGLGLNHGSELSLTITIHPVLCAGLLTTYQEMPLHGENFPRPPPDLVDREEEWEVEKIVDATRGGRGQKLHYLIKWKGFPDSEK